MQSFCENVENKYISVWDRDVMGWDPAICTYIYIIYDIEYRTLFHCPCSIDADAEAKKVARMGNQTYNNALMAIVMNDI